MKSLLLKWLGALTLLLGFGLIFTQCETDLNTIDNTDASLNVLAAVGPTNGDVAELGGGVLGGVLCECIESLAGEMPDAEEIAGLQFMLEEEKMARDVYLALYDIWQLQIFSNIAKAEQRHMDAVLCLFEKYELEPVFTDDVPGQFANGDLQSFYDQSMENGDNSLIEALTVGALIEETDIKDLQDFIAQADPENEDILAVYENLAKGSRNHLRAFNRNLVNRGATYTPTLFSQEEFDAIVNSPWEKGGGLCSSFCPYGNGGGNGNGPGNGGNCPYGNGGGNGNGPGNGGNCPYGNGGGNGNGGNGNGNGNGGGN